MRKVRNAGIVVLVMALLAVASYRIWTSESQVRRRILAEIEPYVAGPVSIRGPTADILRGVRIDEIAIPARPRVRSETFAELFDIRLARGGGQREGRGWVANVRRGEISIERGPDGRWNFEDIFKPGLPLSDAGGVRVVAFQEFLLLRIEASEGGGSSREEVLRLSDLRVTRGKEGALVLSAAARHPYFKEATIRARYEAATAQWHLEIEVDSLRASGDELARWLPAPLSDLPWQGIVDAHFDLETHRTGPLAIRGEIVHYDGKLKLPSPLPPVDHLAGRIKVHRDAASLLQSRGSLAGMDASVQGDLWKKEKGAEVRLECGSLALSSLGGWSSDPRLTAWLARAAPLGSAQGILRVRDLLTPEPLIEGSFSGSARSAIGIDGVEGSVEIGGGTAVHVRSARILGIPIGPGEGRLEFRDDEPTLVFPRIDVPGGAAEASVRLARTISPPGLAGSLRAERLALAGLLAGLGVRVAEARGDLSLTARIGEPNGITIAGETAGGPIVVRGIEDLKGLPADIVAILEEPLSVRLSFALGRGGFRGHDARLVSRDHLALAHMEAGEDGAWSASVLLAKDSEPGAAPIPIEALREWTAARAPLVFRGHGAGGAVQWEPGDSDTFWAGFTETP